MQQPGNYLTTYTTYTYTTYGVYELHILLVVGGWCLPETALVMSTNSGFD